MAERRMERFPFSKRYQLNNEFDLDEQQEHLPGHPRVKLETHKKLAEFHEREFCSADLEKMAPRLWMMSKQDSKSISPLHRQRVKNRDIVITEDPRLHLVWIYNRIFIKPLPKYLMSRAFWERYLLNDNQALGNRQEKISRAALGYLRTYFYLVKHESDFRMAQDEDAQLIPKGVSWEDFCNFSSDFESIRDSDVSGRYEYGEIRLTRLNMYSKIFLRKMQFHRVDHQYGAYFARFYGPIIFIFGIFSVILSGMQVEIAVEQLDAGGRWVAFHGSSRWFSIISIVFAVALSLGLSLMLVYKVVKEWQYAIADRIRKKRGGGEAGRGVGY